MSFLVRPLEDLSLGSKIRSLRKRQGISLTEVAKMTQIQRKFLEAFENDAYQVLPDPIYSRHYLKQFIEVLNGDPEYFLARFDEECGISTIKSKEMHVPRQKVSVQSFLQWRRISGKFAIAFGAILMLLYIGFQIYMLTSPPRLVVDSPSNNIQTTIATLDVTGQTEAEVRILINDEPVLTDPTGRFFTKTTLTRGLNIITIEARRKYGKSNVILRTVFLEDLSSMR